MLIKRTPDIPSSEITPRSLFLGRREFLQASAAAVASAVLLDRQTHAQGLAKLPDVLKSPLSVTEPPTSYADITSYNNFYEFDGRAGGGPKARAQSLKVSPWKIAIEGEVAKPASYALEDFIKPHRLEERIYRFRCVEAWSAVIPWVGIPLRDVIARVQPTSKARFLEFITLHDLGQFPMQRTDLLEWPYREGLRLDEAMHPLAILAVGVYGEELPKQNGAPIRLVVPWKYGFKGAKSLVKIRFVEKQPRTTWMIKEGSAYGFYANVNPQVEHPRWTQSRERRLGEFRYRATQMFNGYGDQVASLYTGMDLRKNY